MVETKDHNYDFSEYRTLNYRFELWLPNALM